MLIMFLAILIFKKGIKKGIEGITLCFLKIEIPSVIELVNLKSFWDDNFPINKLKLCAQNIRSYWPFSNFPVKNTHVQLSVQGVGVDSSSCDSAAFSRVLMDVFLMVLEFDSLGFGLVKSCLLCKHSKYDLFAI